MAAFAPLQEYKRDSASETALGDEEQHVLTVDCDTLCRGGRITVPGVPAVNIPPGTLHNSAIVSAGVHWVVRGEPIASDGVKPSDASAVHALVSSAPRGKLLVASVIPDTLRSPPVAHLALVASVPMHSVLHGCSVTVLHPRLGSLCTHWPSGAPPAWYIPHAGITASGHLQVRIIPRMPEWYIAARPPPVSPDAPHMLTVNAEGVPEGCVTVHRVPADGSAGAAGTVHCNGAVLLQGAQAPAQSPHAALSVPRVALPLTAAGFQAMLQSTAATDGTERTGHVALEVASGHAARAAPQEDTPSSCTHQ